MDMREIQKDNATCDSCLWCDAGKCIFGPVSLDLPERRTCAQHPVHQLALHTWLHKQCYGDAEVFCPPQEDERTGRERRATTHGDPMQAPYGKGRRPICYAPRRQKPGTIADRHIQTSPFPPRTKSPGPEESHAYAMLLEQRDEARADLEKVRAELAACAAGPYEEFDPAKHKDWMLCKFAEYKTPEVYSLDIATRTPTHVAELHDAPKDGQA